MDIKIRFAIFLVLFFLSFLIYAALPIAAEDIGTYTDDDYSTYDTPETPEFEVCPLLKNTTSNETELMEISYGSASSKDFSTLGAYHPGPCEYATQKGQCVYIDSNYLTSFADKTLESYGASPDKIRDNCGKVLVLTSGHPMDNDLTLSTNRVNEGCDLGGVENHDCVTLEDFSPEKDSVLILISSEWPEYGDEEHVDHIMIDGEEIYVEDWDEYKTLKTNQKYGPDAIGTVMLSGLNKEEYIDITVADTYDKYKDTIVMVAPIDCFDTRPSTEVSCGNGILESNEECDDGNNVSGDGCDSECNIEVSCPDGAKLIEYSIHERPDFAKTGNSMVDVSHKLCSDTYLILDTGSGHTRYIHMEWDLSEAKEYDNIDYANLEILHKEYTTLIEIEMQNDEGDWFEICDPPENKYDFVWDYCNLEPYLEDHEEDTLKLRIKAHKTACYTSREYLACARLNAQFYDCESLCGNGILDPGEECDDGNNIDGDGCSSSCTIENDNCAALSIGFWSNHHGCPSPGSYWKENINILSEYELEGAFKDTTGAEICDYLDISDCGSGSTVEGQLCRARGMTLADHSNVVTGRLQLDALIAGAYDGDDAFNNLEINPTDTIHDALETIEIIIEDPTHTRDELRDAAYVAERIYSFYENENEYYPDCIYEYAYCGDGVVNQPDEECDGTDGIGQHQTCSKQCEIIDLTYCGDSIKQTPNDEGTGGPLDDGYEECDSQDGVGQHQTCSQNCEIIDLTYCGDSIKQTPNDEGTGGPLDDGYEECDGQDGVGQHQTCSQQCEIIDLTYCGDSIKQTPNDEGNGGPLDDGYEECDGTDGVPENYICHDNCTLEYIHRCENLTYITPYYHDGISQWIDTESRIAIYDEDGYDTCANMSNTYYKNHLLTGSDEIYCKSEEDCMQWTASEKTAQGWTTYTGLIEGGNESCHVIEHYSGNGDVYWDCIYLDKTAPKTNKSYLGDSYFKDENGTEWINSNTTIKLEASDPEPHPSGVNKTYIEVTRLKDEGDWDYCRSACESWGEDERSMKYRLENQMAVDPEVYDPDSSYKIERESCHIIEYYSTDNVDKTEDVRWQCVFVDNNAPDPTKEVGEPKEMWDGADATYYPEIRELCWNNESDGIECWKVTTLTPIHMSCEDKGPHPVDNEELCYQVELDGDDYTEDYCQEEMKDGWCCGMQEGTQFYFNEESEHNLKYYCVDALGNTGPIDEEKFKVEGTAFEIELNKKWNLISVPFVMVDGSIEKVFEDIASSINSVWTYDTSKDEWYVYTPGPGPDTLGEMRPGWGYWIKANDDTNLSMQGSLFSPASSIPEKEISPGWNLIGYYGTEGVTDYDGPFGTGKYASDVLSSIGNSIWDKGWTSLLTYWEPDNPEAWILLGPDDNMYPGAGYWLLAQEDAIYAISMAQYLSG